MNTNRVSGHSWLRKIPIAHRGLHDTVDYGEGRGMGIPENSLGAFKNAIRHHYAIETDVQLTKDGEVVIFHDYNIKRMTGMDCLVAELNLADLQSLKLLQTPFTVPTLKETLKLVSGRTPLLIEIKNDGSPGELEEKVCQILKEYEGDFALQSFNPFSLQAVKRHNPMFLRGQLSSQFKKDRMKQVKRFVMEHFLLNFLSDPDFIAYHVKDLPNPTVEKFRKKGMCILAWTVKSEKDLKRAEKYCDNVIFENIIV